MIEVSSSASANRPRIRGVAARLKVLLAALVVGGGLAAGLAPAEAGPSVPVATPVQWSPNGGWGPGYPPPQAQPNRGPGWNNGWNNGRHEGWGRGPRRGEVCRTRYERVVVRRPYRPPVVRYQPVRFCRPAW